jgi:protocatechuate 3,4-dioxygenase beta subunit
MAPGPPPSLDRRKALALLGRAGVLLVAGCGSVPEGPACVMATELTTGPYWRDAPLHRSDLRWDTAGTEIDPRPGVLLQLAIRVLTASDASCRPVRGARVDVWHCDARGVYSDVADRGTAGHDFLRGYQVTDGAGQVTFSTIFPGWYAGRTVHVHARVRLFDPFGLSTTDVSTQLFFDDAVTDAVLATAPYVERGPRDTRTATDPIYGGHSELLVALAGQVSSGYRGEVTLGIPIGEVRPG